MSELQLSRGWGSTRVQGSRSPGQEAGRASSEPETNVSSAPAACATSSRLYSLQNGAINWGLSAQNTSLWGSFRSKSYEPLTFSWCFVCWFSYWELNLGLHACASQALHLVCQLYFICRQYLSKLPGLPLNCNPALGAPSSWDARHAYPTRFRSVSTSQTISYVFFVCYSLASMRLSYGRYFLHVLEAK